MFVSTYMKNKEEFQMRKYYIHRDNNQNSIYQPGSICNCEFCSTKTILLRNIIKWSHKYLSSSLVATDYPKFVIQCCCTGFINFSASIKCENCVIIHVTFRKIFNNYAWHTLYVTCNYACATFKIYDHRHIPWITCWQHQNCFLCWFSGSRSNWCGWYWLGCKLIAFIEVTRTSRTAIHLK